MKEELQKLKMELEHLERTHKAGIIKEKEYLENKAIVEKKIQKLQQKLHHEEESRKIITEMLHESPRMEKKMEKKAPSLKSVAKQTKKKAESRESKLASSIAEKEQEMKVESKEEKQIEEIMPTDGWSIAVYLLTIILIVTILFFAYKYTQNQQVSTKIVTVYEFSDFQCEYCKAVQPILQQLKEYYKDNIRIVHKHFPLEELHPGTILASEAAECANKQEAFAAYAVKLYEKQEWLKNVTATEGISNYMGELQYIASLLDLDMEAFKACQKSRETNLNVLQDLEKGRAKGVISTPTFFIGDKKLVGVQSFAVFQYYIEQERRK